MAGILFISSVSSTTVVAEDKKTAPPKKRTPCSYECLLIRNKRAIIQKSFLVGLLCAIGADVYIKFQRNRITTDSNYIVTKIGDFNLDFSNYKNHTLQMKSLLETLKNKSCLIDFKCDLKVKDYTFNCIKVNDYYLTHSDIINIGEKILNIIYRRKLLALATHQMNLIVNLSEDALIKQEITYIFEDILNRNNHVDENSLNFYTKPLNSYYKRMNPVTNIDHINYVKNFPEYSSSVVFCYQKTFFLGLLSVYGIDIEVKNIIKNVCGFPDCLVMCKIKNKTVYATEIKTPQKYAKYIVNAAYTIFPPEKVKMESFDTLYNIPQKVTIGNIVLDEIDIFNLGQKFYEVGQNIMSYIFRIPVPLNSVILNELPGFTEGIKNEFKQYTGRDLPNLDS